MAATSARSLPGSLLLLLVAGCASTPVAAPPPPPTPKAVPEIRPGIPAGYLGRALPDSLALLPPPPAKGSPGFARDQAVSRASQTLRRTPRYALASADADLRFPHIASAFACALGVPISQQDTPRLYLLLQRSLVDAGLATYAAKDHYKRTRPFVYYKEATCAPADEAQLRGDGSYPSGHTAIGWTWALLLTELSPGQADALLARGRAFGENRLICNAHWQSDILQGRAVAAGAVATLHANADFLADMSAARAEIASLRGSSETPTGCDAEATALAVKIPGVE
ncbi:acid phosphatase [Stenotrophomonas sp. LGBM10]|uniref:acid phosphatase n=1 Tax=Stenotrophomonas sp. LGBM10 TaxID=3390038 RepID=UPI00398B3E0A